MVQKEAAMSHRMVLSAFLMLGLVGCASDGGGGGGGGTARELCEQAQASMCQVFLSCLPPAQLAQLGFPATQDACAAKLAGQSGCALLTDQNPCPAGQAFHADQAELCVEQLRALTCDALRGGGADPRGFGPACSKVCT